MSGESGEAVRTEFWLWDAPHVLGMPVILEVRVWQSRAHRVETPQHVFVHWESVNAAWPQSLQPEELILSPERFAQLRATDEVVLIGGPAAPTTDGPRE